MSTVFLRAPIWSEWIENDKGGHHPSGRAAECVTHEGPHLVLREPRGFESFRIVPLTQSVRFRREHRVELVAVD